MSDHVKICQYVRCSNILTGKQEKWCSKQCAKSQKERDKRKSVEGLEICANAKCNNHLTGRQRKYCSKKCNAYQWLLDNPTSYPKCGVRWCESDTSHGGFGYCTRHYDSLTAGCVDIDPRTPCMHNRSSNFSVQPSVCTHHAIQVNHTEIRCEKTRKPSTG